MLINELKRAFINKKFLIIILLGFLVHFLSGFDQIKDYIFYDYSAPDLQSPAAQEAARKLVSKGLNFYTVWFETLRFYVLAMPILAGLAYSTSYLEDKKYNMIKYINIRVNHKKYIFSKLLVNSLVGGVSVALPTIISIIIVSIFSQGSINDFYAKGMYGGVFANLLVYSFPIYALLHIFIEFIFGFAYANIALAMSTITKNKIAVLLSPVLFWIVGSAIFSLFNITYYTPGRINQYYLNPTVTFREIAIELLVITLICSIIFIYRTQKRKIYEN